MEPVPPGPLVPRTAREEPGLGALRPKTPEPGQSIDRDGDFDPPIDVAPTFQPAEPQPPPEPEPEPAFQPAEPEPEPQLQLEQHPEPDPTPELEPARRVMGVPDRRHPWRSALGLIVVIALSALALTGAVAAAFALVALALKSAAG